MLNKKLKRYFSEEMIEYRKLDRRHKKELIKLIKTGNNWDFECLHKLVMLKVIYMHQFYINGNNVWQENNKRLMLIKELEYVIAQDRQIRNLIECIADESYHEKVQNLYEDVYSFIGKHIQNWWD